MRMGIHFFHRRFVTDDRSILLENTAEHIDYELIDKASLTIVKEMIEGAFKLLENFGVLDKICLHLWSDLLVEGELFYHKVEVIQECLLHVFTNIAV